VPNDSSATSETRRHDHDRRPPRSLRVVDVREQGDDEPRVLVVEDVSP
jgi:hypothetical protein